MIVQEEMKRLKCTRSKFDYAYSQPLVKINEEGHLAYRLSIFGEATEIIDIDNLDPMEWHIKCPYCGEITAIGLTRMISGYAGCDNCYFASGGLVDTVMYLREYNYEMYKSGEFYKKGHKQ